MGSLESGGVTESEKDKNDEKDLQKSPSVDSEYETADERTLRNRIVWIILLIGVLGGFAYHFSTLVMKFRKYDSFFTNQAVNVRAQRTKIMFCSHTFVSPVRYQYEHNPNRLVANTNISYLTVMNENAVKLWFLTTYNTTNTTGVDVFTLADNLRPVKMSLIPEFARSFAGPNLADFLLVCVYNGHPCGLANFTTIYFGDQTCFQFNPSPETAVVKDAEPGLLMSLSTFFLQFLNDDREFFVSYEGMKFFVFDADTWPNMEQVDGRVSMKEYVNFKVSAVERIQFYKDSNPCRDGRRQEICFLQYNKGRTCRIVEETAALCRQIAVQRQLVARCDCVTYEWPIPKDMNHKPMCHEVPRQAFINRGYRLDAGTGKWKIITVDSAEILLDSVVNISKLNERNQCYMAHKKEWSSILNSACRPLCRQKESASVLSRSANLLFDFSERYTMLDDILRPIFRDRIEDAKQNGDPHIYIEMFLNRSEKRRLLPSEIKTCSIVKIDWNPQGQIVTEDVQYKLTNMLADMGGTIGLWIGASVITVFQLLDAFYGYVYSKVKKKADQ